MSFADQICLITGAAAVCADAAAALLVSDASRFVMDSGVTVDGGMTGCRWSAGRHAPPARSL